MGRVQLPDTIRRTLEADGRLPATGPPAAPRVTLSRAEDWPGSLAVECVRLGLAPPVREHRFHPVRRWRFDLAWPDRLVAVEVDGGAFIGGRHTSGAGFRVDCVKLSEAAALGWRVLRVMPEHVEDGSALGWVLRALEPPPSG